MGPVIEGERYPAFDGARDLQGLRSPRDDWGEQVSEHGGMMPRAWRSSSGDTALGDRQPDL
jgi:hypothetical protein